MSEGECQLICNVKISEKEEFIDVLVLKNKKIGVLFESKFIIFDSHTFAKLITIEEEDIIFYKAIEINHKNKNFILLMSSKYIFVYLIKNKSYEIIQKIETLPKSLIEKISESEFIIYNNYDIYHYKYHENKDMLNIFINYKKYNCEKPPVQNDFPEIKIKNESDFKEISGKKWINDTYKIKKILYLPYCETLLLCGERKFVLKRKEPFVRTGYGDPFEEEVDCNIYLCKDMCIFKYDLYGNLYRTLFRCGSLYDEGHLLVDGSIDKMNNYIDLSFDSLMFEKIEFTVYKNFLLFKIGRSDYTLIDIENGKSKSNNWIFSDSYYDIFPIFLSKNILIALEPYFYSIELCEYNKIDDINYKRKVIFEDKFRKIEKAKGFKIKDLLFYYIYTENNNSIKVFKLYN